MYYPYTPYVPSQPSAGQHGPYPLNHNDHHYYGMLAGTSYLDTISHPSLLRLMCRSYKQSAFFSRGCATHDPTANEMTTHQSIS